MDSIMEQDPPNCHYPEDETTALTALTALPRKSNAQHDFDEALPDQLSCARVDQSTSLAASEETKLWVELEVCRRAAAYHLECYIRDLKAFEKMHGTADQTPSLEIAPLQQDTGTSEYWRMKISRDNLVRDLKELGLILDLVRNSFSKKASKSLSVTSILGVGIAVTVSCLEGVAHSRESVGIAAKWTALLAFGMSTVHSSFRGGEWFSAKLCKKSVDKILTGVAEENLDNVNPRAFEGAEFRTLRWIVR